MNRERIEAKKERLTDRYNAAMEAIYLKELERIFLWFKKKFPKRKLKWWSGMGTCFWEIDGETLEWDVIVPTYDSHCYQTGWKEPKPGRKEKVLMPLWELYMSINDHTHFQGYAIDTGNFTMDMVEGKP